MSKKQYIVWDLGATKCAAAYLEYDSETTAVENLKRSVVRLRDCTSLDNLIDKLEAEMGHKMSDVDANVICGAGQFDGENLNLATGYPYPMTFLETSKKRDWAPWAVTHDYVPIVTATFTDYMKHPGNIKMLHEGKMNPYGRRVAFGIGTGLGLKDGLLFPDGRFWLGTNEIGHIGITSPPAATPEELRRHQEFVRFYHDIDPSKKNEALTFEEILSGRGTTKIHQFLTGQTDLTPEEIGAQIKAGWAPETFSMFAWYLGLFVGVVQLIFMPSGGIWITGGVVLKHMGVFDQPEFQRAIEATPAYLDLRKDIPLGVMQSYEHAFYGGAYYTSHKLAEFIHN